MTLPAEMGVSESMSEREIEDVLNSVRRLVAQAERRSTPAPLVLTPDMRVDPPRAEPPDRSDAPARRAGTFQTVQPVQRDTPGAGADPGRAQPSAPAEPSAQSDPAGAADPDGAGEAAGDEPEAFLPETRTPGQGMPALLDEHALQDMVTQIVRDELHGKLGERITLAVRKLVRNEIARALDEQRRK
jgi:hypothetical protein